MLWASTGSGGCARKLSPSHVLTIAPWLRDASDRFMEDSAVVSVGGGTVIQTLDFVTSMVPSPQDFGRIAAANALSDVYVVGGWPRFALSIACVPGGPAVEEFADALAAARDFLAERGCELIGGHSVVDGEAKLGFAVTGVPNGSGRLVSSGARVGDAVVLTKAIGVGVICSALKIGLIGREEISDAVAAMTSANEFVPALLESHLGPELHAATDVTGFGLLGHSCELSRRSGVGIALELAGIPILPGARALALRGVCTSASASNEDWARRVGGVAFAGLAEADRILLADPQTSGGVLMAIAPGAIPAVAEFLRERGVAAHVIGAVVDGTGVTIG